MATRSIKLEAPASFVSAEYLPRAALVIGRAFDTLAFSGLLGITTKTLSQAEFDEFYISRVSAFVKHGGVLIQSHDFAAVALWLPPASGSRDEANAEPLNDGMRQIWETFDYAEEKYGYGKVPHWHLQYVARDPLRPSDESTKGAVSNVVKPMLRHAKEVDHVPAVLESAGGKSTAVYLHWGFELLEKLEIGDSGIEVDYMVFNK